MVFGLLKCSWTAVAGLTSFMKTRSIKCRWTDHASSKAIPPFEVLSPVEKHDALGELSWMCYLAHLKTTDPKSYSFMWSPSTVGTMPSSDGMLSHASKLYPITGT